MTPLSSLSAEDVTNLIHQLIDAHRFDYDTVPNRISLPAEMLNRLQHNPLACSATNSAERPTLFGMEYIISDELKVWRVDLCRPK